jgi:hypothetical protein
MQAYIICLIAFFFDTTSIRQPLLKVQHLKQGFFEIKQSKKLRMICFSETPTPISLLGWGSQIRTISAGKLNYLNFSRGAMRIQIALLAFLVASFTLGASQGYKHQTMPST